MAIYNIPRAKTWQEIAIPNSDITIPEITVTAKAPLKKKEVSDEERKKYEVGRINLMEQPVEKEALQSKQGPYNESIAYNNLRRAWSARPLDKPYYDNVAPAAAEYQLGASADPLAPVKDIPGPKKGMSATTAGSIASGVLGVAQAASSIYGAKLADKMQPSLMSYQAPIEPELMESNTEALKSAAKESIATQTATARASDRGAGIIDGGRNAIYLAKGIEAENQVAGQLAQMDMQLQAQNTQSKNQAKQFNAQMGMQTEQFNAQTKNQFDQWKSSVVGAGYSNALNGLSGATGAIMNNMNLQDTIARADAKNAEALKRYTQETTREESRFKIQTLLEQLRMPGLSLQQKADIQNEIKTLQV